jgi:hypothetical protein
MGVCSNTRAKMKGIRCSSSKPGSSKAIEINATDEGYITVRSGTKMRSMTEEKKKFRDMKGKKTIK